jgi:hypothetical protein
MSNSNCSPNNSSSPTMSGPSPLPTLSAAEPVTAAALAVAASLSPTGTGSFYGLSTSSLWDEMLKDAISSLPGGTAQVTQLQHILDSPASSSAEVQEAMKILWPFYIRQSPKSESEMGDRAMHMHVVESNGACGSNDKVDPSSAAISSAESSDSDREALGLMRRSFGSGLAAAIDRLDDRKQMEIQYRLAVGHLRAIMKKTFDLPTAEPDAIQQLEVLQVQRELFQSNVAFWQGQVLMRTFSCKRFSVCVDVKCMRELTLIFSSKSILVPGIDFDAHMHMHMFKFEYMSFVHVHVDCVRSLQLHIIVYVLQLQHRSCDTIMSKPVTNARSTNFSPPKPAFNTRAIDRDVYSLRSRKSRAGSI